MYSPGVIRYLGFRGFANRTGLKYNYVRWLWYNKRHLLPTPDAEVVDDIENDEEIGSPLWTADTADKWERVGRGKRTDLEKP